MPDPLKSLSVRQPWARLLVNGEKDIENRTFRTSHRGLLLIHASAKAARLTPEQTELVETSEDEGVQAWLDGEPIVGGALIGAVNLDQVHHSRHGFLCSAWGEVDPDVFHWHVKDAVMFDKPIRMRGSLGIRAIPGNLEEKARSALARAGVTA